MEHDNIDAGYSLKYGRLDVSHFGVATARKRLILIVAAPGLELPEWLHPTHGGDLNPVVTLRDAIGDLEWENNRLYTSTKQWEFFCESASLRRFLRGLRVTQTNESISATII